ncbi:hypothetical protein A2671_01865 [Candidatus Kaiserbacteria bacterium RIFCSPHIGHO2_01_FULL_49_13]|uniref:Uncharacterized protein n=1 Tax=Candidatus Kaiserbacteria bacterium RIFCSPHIGHO2_01_FULL_49_13 TaxID=1798477 RepID=A0A1F6CDM7_9BACT|nr:MAG: hypothetical protein A2671_01865 [Candidatus Kaiserbacteria bacterium RIFCSPHIGHO2_01_FULL_49_13]
MNDEVGALMARINAAIINPLIALLFVAALAIFILGIAEFIWKADTDDGREVGKQHMIWGIIGMVLMTGVYGVLTIATNTFGIRLP